jgi:16S rRNA (adenine1518-N6/adenine1519-N6)-dimethyltransferase
MTGHTLKGRRQVSVVREAPVQPSLRRIRQFGVRPDRDLGQNFLIDSNILGVIERAAELDREDVVLEIGGGLGVLSEYLAERVAHVHVIEIDERLRDALQDAAGPHANVAVHWADAMTFDLSKLDPPPDKIVANLPYGIAAGVLLRSIEELPSVRLWVAMAQREVGERLAASPGSSAYGTPSVLAQLVCDVRVLRAVPRTVFHPVPNVDSVLVGLYRRAPQPAAAAPVTAASAGAPAADASRAGDPAQATSRALRALVSGGFAHRRKTLAGSLALSGGGSGALPPRSRERVREALLALGHPADVRAERLSPEDFRALAGLLEL